MVQCLTSARFNMKADILKQDSRPSVEPGLGSTSTNSGHYENSQDPLTGEIVRVWVVSREDDPDTPENEYIPHTTIKCQVRGVIDGGIRVAGTTERFGEIYENVDFVKMNFGTKVIVTKRDRVTNVRGRDGKIIWIEEEMGGTDYKPTVFNVLGVTPIIDPFGKHVENIALLERAEVQ